MEYTKDEQCDRERNMNAQPAVEPAVDRRLRKQLPPFITGQLQFLNDGPQWLGNAVFQPRQSRGREGGVRQVMLLGCVLIEKIGRAHV